MQSPGSPDNPQLQSELAEPPPRPSIPHLKGLDAAEGWLLGALLAQPPLYEKLRDEMSLTMFITFRALAERLLELFENHPDLAACSLAELISDLDNPLLVGEAIELERKTSDWLDPANLSPSQLKLLKQSLDDRGQTLTTVAYDSLKELRSARGNEDPAIASDLDANTIRPDIPPPSADPNTIDFSQFDSIKRRNAKGGNRRITGI